MRAAAHAGVRSRFAHLGASLAACVVWAATPSVAWSQASDSVATPATVSTGAPAADVASPTTDATRAQRARGARQQLHRIRGSVREIPESRVARLHATRPQRRYAFERGPDARGQAPRQLHCAGRLGVRREDDEFQRTHSPDHVGEATACTQRLGGPDRRLPARRPKPPAHHRNRRHRERGEPSDGSGGPPRRQAGAERYAAYRGGKHRRPAENGKPCWPGRDADSRPIRLAHGVAVAGRTTHGESTNASRRRGVTGRAAYCNSGGGVRSSTSPLGPSSRSSA